MRFCRLAEKSPKSAQVVRVCGHGAGRTAKPLVDLLWFGHADALRLRHPCES